MSRDSATRWLEPLLAAGVLLPLVWHIWHLQTFGYLAAPFFYEPSDTFMDWFNTAYWAHDPGAYDNWGTIYPPLSFVLLRHLSLKHCYIDNFGLTPRDCDWPGLVLLGLVFTLNFVLVLLAFRKLDRSTAWPRALALGFGLPMLYALERGNLLLLAFTGVLLAFGPLVRQAWLRWLALGLAINLKVYLLAALFPQLLRRRWRWFEGALIATLLVYLVSLALNGAGTPVEIYRNIVAATEVFEAGSFLDGWYAITYRPFMAILESQFIPITSIIGSDAVEGLVILLPLLQRFTQLLIIAAALAVWLRPEAVATHSVTFLGLLMALVTSESGGYTQIFLVLFVFMERWRGLARPIAIVMAYLLSAPIDINIDRLVPAVRESYLAGGPVLFDFVLIGGPFVRPLLVMVVAWCIAGAVIADVARDSATHPAPWRRRFAGEPLGA